jgi:hypothetical protein
MRNIFLASAAAATALAGLGFNAPAFAQSGSYGGSCRNTQSANGVLTAECADGQGRYHMSSIPFNQCRGDIGNNNGMLTCNGATGTGGQIVGGGDNRGRNNNNGNVAGAAAAGVVAGAILGGALAGDRNQAPRPLYQQGYNYPTYGQPQYGDPRYDPRYAQGGYGYGRPTNQFIPIAQRAQWLDQRINKGIQEGTLDRGEVRSLRDQLRSLEDRENRYRRQGMQGWMMADLDKRFDQVASRIQYERTDGDHPKYRDNRNYRDNNGNRYGR